MNNQEIACKAASVLKDKKALDVVVIDISLNSSFADYLVVASGNSERQIGTLSEEVEEQLAKDGMFAKSVEGKKSSGWILMDFGDVIINLFSTEQRERYKIEQVWSDGNFLTLDDH